MGGAPTPVPRRRGVAGRSRSLHRPTARADHAPAPPTRLQRVGSVLRGLLGWSGWTKIAAMTTTIAAIGALWFTSQSLVATNKQYGLSQQVAVTDRFQKAAEELASERIDVRLSGIYLLERLAEDSADDHPTVFEVLAAFLRTHTNPSECHLPAEDRIPVDIQAALTVIGRRDVSHETADDVSTGTSRDLNLYRTCLAGAQLSDANFARAYLYLANLASGSFTHANLTRAVLTRANLVGASIDYTDLTHAILEAANLTDAKLYETNLTGVNLSGAILTGAQLYSVNLTDVKGLGSADLTGVLLNSVDMTGLDTAGMDLTGAILEGVDFTGTDLQEVNLADIYYNSRTVWPDGFTPPLSRPKR